MGWTLIDTGQRGMHRFHEANAERTTIIDGYYIVQDGVDPLNPQRGEAIPLDAPPAGWDSLCALLWHVPTGLGNRHLPTLAQALLRDALRGRE